MRVALPKRIGRRTAVSNNDVAHKTPFPVFFWYCGTWTLHNRVGTLGVVLGNDSDPRTGLPLQSVQAADGR